MSKPLLGVTLVAAALSAGIVGTASRAAESGFSGTQKTEIEKIVRDYLTANPQILLEMSQELEKKQNAEQEAQITKAIADNREALYRSPLAHVAGNPQGDVTVVEFFDYNCGFCKRALGDVLKLIQADPKVRVVFKELPIFGNDSEQAARAALAAEKQGKYFEMHQKLLSESGPANEAKAMRIAKALGLNIEKLKKDMQDPSIDASLAESKKLADQIGLQGTPLYLVGDKVIPGAPDELAELLVKTAADVRANGCKTAC